MTLISAGAQTEKRRFCDDELSVCKPGDDGDLLRSAGGTVGTVWRQDLAHRCGNAGLTAEISEKPDVCRLL